MTTDSSRKYPSPSKMIKKYLFRVYTHPEDRCVYNAKSNIPAYAEKTENAN